jgi:ABC-type branched-subunit amino acid transport system permease subunit
MKIKIWLSIISLHTALLLAVMFTPIFKDTPMEAFGISLLAIPYFLQQIGLPVLQNNGLSGTGWPTPNLFGWLFSVSTWLAFYWLVVKVLIKLMKKYKSI